MEKDLLIFEDLRFVATAETDEYFKKMQMNRPECDFLLRDFGVKFVKSCPDTFRVIEWERVEGQFSLWASENSCYFEDTCSGTLDVAEDSTKKEVKTRALSWVDLHEEEHPKAEDVLMTLKSYAESGFPVSSKVVISVIEKAEFSKNDILEAYSHALLGLVNKRAEGDSNEIKEYAKIVRYLYEDAGDTVLEILCDLSPVE